MNSYFYYNTPVNEFQTHYGNVHLPFKSEDITTQLPKEIAVIRAVAALALTAYVALKLSATIFCWPVAVVGLAFAGWTIYSHVLSKDPLMEAFYQISGGKAKFEQLPEIQIHQAPDEKLVSAIRRISWGDLKNPIARAKTLDGRNVVILKGLSRYPGGYSHLQVQSVLAFVEKLGPYDISRVISNSPELLTSALHATGGLLDGNTYRQRLDWSDTSSGVTKNWVYSSISGNMANELFAQMNHS